MPTKLHTRRRLLVSLLVLMFALTTYATPAHPAWAAEPPPPSPHASTAPAGLLCDNSPFDTTVSELSLAFPGLCSQIRQRYRTPIQPTCGIQRYETRPLFPSLPDFLKIVNRTEEELQTCYFDVWQAFTTNYFNDIDPHWLAMEVRSLLPALKGSRTSLNLVAQMLGVTPKVIQDHAPEQARQVIEIVRRPLDLAAIEQELRAVLADTANPLPQMKDITRKLGCRGTQIRQHFPDLYDQFMARRFGVRNREQVEQALAYALECEPPQTLAQFEKNLGYKRGFLQQYYAPECRLIAERRAKYEQERKQKRNQAVCEDIRCAVRSCYQSGEAINIETIERVIGVKGFSRNPVCYEAWKDAISSIIERE